MAPLVANFDDGVWKNFPHSLALVFETEEEASQAYLREFRAGKTSVLSPTGATK